MNYPRFSSILDFRHYYADCDAQAGNLRRGQRIAVDDTEVRIPLHRIDLQQLRQCELSGQAIPRSHPQTLRKFHYLTSNNCIIIINTGANIGLTTGAHWTPSVTTTPRQVGMLGANAPKKTKKTWNISIAGKVIYPVKPKWGHMISSHYLKYLKKGDYPNSKLHKYIEEATPPANWRWRVLRH